MVTDFYTALPPSKYVHASFNLMIMLCYKVLKANCENKNIYMFTKTLLPNMGGMKWSFMREYICIYLGRSFTRKYMVQVISLSARIAVYLKKK